MESKTSVATRARSTTTFVLFIRRWPSAAGFTGMLALLPASIAILMVPGRLELLSIVGVVGLWFLGAGTLGGTAIALQHALRQPRVVAPLFAAGIVLLVGAILWVSIGLLDPISPGLYTLAVSGPFVLTLVVVVTSAAALIPSRYRKGVSTLAVVVSAVIAILSIFT
ncbi:hypothetical protein CW368_05200 [Actinomycetales bacterium SN12]|nr:hypothetical protein CW368_05200 [Actinomycetales bacterium SN12]